MRIIFRDLLIVIFIFFLFIFYLFYNINKGNEKLIEVLYAFPGQLLITIGYYAICNVCYSILFISDCENEYGELMSQLKEGRKFFEKKGIKYN